MGGIKNVGTPVAEGAGAVVEPGAPLLGVEFAAEGVLGGVVGPSVPVHAFGKGIRGIFFYGCAPAVPAALVVHEGGDAGDVFDEASFGPGFELEVVASGVALVAHLGDDAGTVGEVDEALSLAEGVSERFFDVDVLAEGHGEHGDAEVGVVGGSDEDGVDVVRHGVEELAEVGEGFGLGKEGLGFGGVGSEQVDVAEGHDLAESASVEGFEVVEALVADADDGEVNGGGGRALPAQETGGEEGEGAEGGGGFDEMAAGGGRGVFGVGLHGLDGRELGLEFNSLLTKQTTC